MKYFLIRLKNVKPKRGRQTGYTRMTKVKIIEFFEKHQLIHIDGLIYDNDDKIVGSLLQKEVNQTKITELEFKTLPMIKIMKKLGSLQTSNYWEYRNIGIKRKDNLDIW